MRAKVLLSALAVTVLSGAAFASTYDYFKIHAKNITPVYTSGTIQIEGATEVQTTQIAQPAVQTSVQVESKSVQPVVDVNNVLEQPTTVQTPAVQIPQPVSNSLANQEKVVNDKLSGSVEETVNPNVHFGQCLTNYQAQTKLEDIGNSLTRNASLSKPVSYVFSSDETNEKVRNEKSIFGSAICFA